MEIPTNALLIFLGSILTFWGTWLVESWKNKQERNDKAQNFKLLAKQELRIVVSILDNLRTTLEHKNYYDINTRNRLNASKFALENYRKDAIYLSNQDLQEKFIDVVSTISDYYAKIDSLQNLFWSEQKILRDKSKAELASTPTSSKKKVEAEPPDSIFKSDEDLTRFFNETKLQYSIEHAELKREIEELIKEFDK